MTKFLISLFIVIYIWQLILTYVICEVENEENWGWLSFRSAQTKKDFLFRLLYRFPFIPVIIYLFIVIKLSLVNLFNYWKNLPDDN